MALRRRHVYEIAVTVDAWRPRVSRQKKDAPSDAAHSVIWKRLRTQVDRQPYRLLAVRWIVLGWGRLWVKKRGVIKIKISFCIVSLQKPDEVQHYAVSGKTKHLIFGHNLGKCTPIFQINFPRYPRKSCNYPLWRVSTPPSVTTHACETW